MMIRVLRYPRLCAVCCVGVLASAVARDLCVSGGLDGWARVLLVVTLALLAMSIALISCRFFVEDTGVGVGFLLRVQRTPWNELTSLGILCCNSRRTYLYGLYRDSPGFLQLLHHAPYCGMWGFVVPTSRRLISAVLSACPEEIDFSHIPQRRQKERLRILWHQAALYAVVMVPVSVVAFFTGALMLVNASRVSSFALVVGFTLGACALFGAGGLLLYRVMISATTCTRFNEEGVRAGIGMYIPWEEVHFGYVHRMGHVSGMFLLSQPLENAGKRGQPPIRCLSLPDTSTLLLAYLTYCPHAEKGPSR